MRVLPDITLTDCPQLDILVIPGGQGRHQAMKNMEILNFINRQEPQAHYITSVCTGSFLLAEAGLLTGKKATTYHAYYDDLAAYSIEVVREKVVPQGKIVTAGGVSSGIELGFFLLRELFGADVSQQVANKIEYVVDVNQI
jgi:cyclohexyl-isocyanide hydratase